MTPLFGTPNGYGQRLRTEPLSRVPVPYRNQFAERTRTRNVTVPYHPYLEGGSRKKMRRTPRPRLPRTLRRNARPAILL